MAQSRLWKAALLANNSRYFPQMVQAAAWYFDKEYTEHMLRKVAATIEIVDALNIPDGETSVDTILWDKMSDATSGTQVDNLIVTAVTNYTPPAAV